MPKWPQGTRWSAFSGVPPSHPHIFGSQIGTKVADIATLSLSGDDFSENGEKLFGLHWHEKIACPASPNGSKAPPKSRNMHLRSDSERAHGRSTVKVFIITPPLPPALETSCPGTGGRHPGKGDLNLDIQELASSSLTVQWQSLCFQLASQSPMIKLK